MDVVQRSYDVIAHRPMDGQLLLLSTKHETTHGSSNITQPVTCLEVSRRKHIEKLIEQAIFQASEFALEWPGSTEHRQAEATLRYLQSKLC